MGNSEIIFRETSLAKKKTLSRYWEKFPPQGIKSPGNFPELAFDSNFIFRDSLKTSQQTLHLRWNSGMEAKPHFKKRSLKIRTRCPIVLNSSAQTEDAQVMQSKQCYFSSLARYLKNCAMNTSVRCTQLDNFQQCSGQQHQIIRYMEHWTNAKMSTLCKIISKAANQDILKTSHFSCQLFSQKV